MTPPRQCDYGSLAVDRDTGEIGAYRCAAPATCRYGDHWHR